MSERLMAEVEAKLDRLIQQFYQLQAENRSLRQKEQEWMEERARLQEINNLACSRIESLISRLKQFEIDPE
ncbi:TIGR02449 family protein [Saccharophagus sp. K07]|uniref:TIGR02449 family protein n=1 Tax=Saccharophagus sp. K07 TaxID=2283636 RepID=UPI0016522229|nr:TIGR02449 family protein [Saccharophagus sp. K07]MBC6906399.1 TIGR02449 family protein [Saccharophagus sp. K07]